METKLSIPNLGDFTDYREYLRLWFEWRKAVDPAYSYTVFSTKAGFCSRSFPRLVISGKRNLTPDGLRRFCVALELDRKDSEVFSALVNSNQASNFESRRHYWEEFLRKRKSSGRTLKVENLYAYLSEPMNPLLLVLLKQPHVSRTVGALAKMTDLSKANVEKGLSILSNLGLLKKDKDQNWHPTADSVCTSDDIPSVAIQNHHSRMLEKSKEALDQDVEEREFQSAMMALNPDDIKYLKKRIRSWVTEIDEKYSGPRPSAQKAYAININLVPVSTEFIRPDVSDDKSEACQKSGERKTSEEAQL
jgi:uncharacterized protein (TIGR02147 family)